MMTVVAALHRHLIELKPGLLNGFTVRIVESNSSVADCHFVPSYYTNPENNLAVALPPHFSAQSLSRKDMFGKSRLRTAPADWQRHRLPYSSLTALTW